MTLALLLLFGGTLILLCGATVRVWLRARRQERQLAELESWWEGRR